MRVKSKPLVLATIGVLVAFLAAWASGYSLTVNTSVSMPRGLYLVGPLQEPERGMIVAVCIPNQPAVKLYRERDYLPASSRCAGGMAPVMKPIAGVPRDAVRIGALGTWINERQVPNSLVFDTDSQGLPIPHLPLGWSKRLDVGEYFLLATHVERSLDSRYYGPVHRADMQARVIPLVTF